MKATGASFTAEERAQMAANDPSNAFVPYAEGSMELRLYRKFVREFIGSTKLERAKATGAEWHVDRS